MVGASRCIVATLFKFGGPETLPQATLSLCIQTSDLALLVRVTTWNSADNSFARTVIRSTKNKFRAKGEDGFLRAREVARRVRAHVQGREATALFAAAA